MIITDFVQHVNTQIFKLKEKNRALCYRRKSLNNYIGYFQRSLDNGCHDHRYVHKRMLEYIDEVKLLDVLIEANGSEILKLRRELKDVY